MHPVRSSRRALALPVRRWARRPCPQAVASFPADAARRLPIRRKAPVRRVLAQRAYRCVLTARGEPLQLPRATRPELVSPKTARRRNCRSLRWTRVRPPVISETQIYLSSASPVLTTCLKDRIPLHLMPRPSSAPDLSALGRLLTDRAPAASTPAPTVPIARMNLPPHPDDSRCSW